jgi:hypothetical protein
MPHDERLNSPTFLLTTPINRWMIGRGKGHAVVHRYHHSPPRLTDRSTDLLVPRSTTGGLHDGDSEEGVAPYGKDHIMTTWRVVLDYSNTNLGPTNDELKSQFTGIRADLAGYQAAVGRHNSALSINLAVNAVAYSEAMNLAGQAAEHAIRAHGLDAGRVVFASVSEWVRFDRESDSPTSAGGS